MSTPDSVVKSPTNVAEIYADIQLAKRGVIAQDANSLSLPLTRMEETMQQQQVCIYSLEREKLDFGKQMASLEFGKREGRESGKDGRGSRKVGNREGRGSSKDGRRIENTRKGKGPNFKREISTRSVSF